MQGKKFMVSATWNAPREAFDNPQGVLYGGKGGGGRVSDIRTQPVLQGGLV